MWRVYGRRRAAGAVVPLLDLARPRRRRAPCWPGSGSRSATCSPPRATRPSPPASARWSASFAAWPAAARPPPASPRLLALPADRPTATAALPADGSRGRLELRGVTRSAAAALGRWTASTWSCRAGPRSPSSAARARASRCSPPLAGPAGRPRRRNGAAGRCTAAGAGPGPSCAGRSATPSNGRSCSATRSARPSPSVRTTPPGPGPRRPGGVRGRVRPPPARRIRHRLADAPLSGGEATPRPGPGVRPRGTAAGARRRHLQPRHRHRTPGRRRTRRSPADGPGSMVAHRASTAARADLVVWLEGGRIRAVGPHARLWGRPTTGRCSPRATGADEPPGPAGSAGGAGTGGADGRRVVRAARVRRMRDASCAAAVALLRLAAWSLLEAGRPSSAATPWPGPSTAASSPAAPRGLGWLGPPGWPSSSGASAPAGLRGVADLVEPLRDGLVRGRAGGGCARGTAGRCPG